MALEEKIHHVLLEVMCNMGGTNKLFVASDKICLGKEHSSAFFCLLWRQAKRSAGFHDNWVASTKKLEEDESIASAGRLLSSLPLEMLKGQTGFFVN